MAYRVGVDIGGTFADFCAVSDASGQVHTLKVLTTPLTPGAEVMEGIRGLEQRFGIVAGDIRYFTHGTTVGINTVIQRKGIRLCLFTTERFEDVLELARLKMPDPYDLLSKRPKPLVTKERVYGVRERMHADGSIDTPLDTSSLRHALNRALAAGAEGIVLSYLHAYRNPAHELESKALIGRWSPGLPVFCSSEVWPIIREYERTSTAVVHGYVQPPIAAYIESLQRSLRSSGVSAEAMMTTSNGAVMSAEHGKTRCIQMLLSGTAAGAIGAAYIAKLSSLPRVLGLDVGGTSADVSLITDGEPSFRTGELVGEFPIHIPTVAVTSIGAGGGSIAAVDRFGTLTVGPESAGSTPGPACYGHGGTQPTLTDAFVVCGLIGHGDLGYGAVHVDRTLAVNAMIPIAHALDRSVEAAAHAVIDLAISDMYREVSKLAARQGVDLREYALLAFGGAGPMVGALLAKELGTQSVLVPTLPGVLAALGGLVADRRHDFVYTVFAPLDASRASHLIEGLSVMKAQAKQRAREEAITASVLVAALDMRYRGQSFEITTLVELDWIERGDVSRIAQAFHDEHFRIYGHSDEGAAIDVVTLRLSLVCATEKPSLPKQKPYSGNAAPDRDICVHLEGQALNIPLYSRRTLLHGHEFSGPCIIAQEDTTLVVPEGFAGAVDEYGSLRLRLGTKERQ